MDVPPSCPPVQPVLPISHQPKQNQAEGVTAKIKVNPTEVRQEMDLPTFSYFSLICQFLHNFAGQQFFQLLKPEDTVDGLMNTTPAFLPAADRGWRLLAGRRSPALHHAL